MTRRRRNRRTRASVDVRDLAALDNAQFANRDVKSANVDRDVEIEQWRAVWSATGVK